MRDVFKLFEGWRRYKRDDHYSVGTDPFYGPPPLINDVIDCWVRENVRFFTDLHNANGISYHVMLPTKDLEFHIERGTNRSECQFLGQQLIETGYPMNAVRIDVGKNGKAIINRDAEIVMAAKHVGLEQLPVIFNFHKEV
tara:strand:- start:648 stop:1067 length:420 start_codon:yes stop_codon:yes gene_type:complete